MLNNTEYNNTIVIHMSDAQLAQGLTEADIYASIVKDFVGFYKSVRVIVDSFTTKCAREIDALCGEYNKLCTELRDEGLDELLEVAYDDLSRSLAECKERWRDKVAPKDLQILFNETM